MLKMSALLQGIGERITPEENERRRMAGSPEAMGLVTATDQGLLQGIGERITPEENARRLQAASPEAMGVAPKNLGVGFGPFVSAAQKLQINRNACTDFWRKNTCQDKGVVGSKNSREPNFEQRNKKSKEFAGRLKNS